MLWSGIPRQSDTDAPPAGCIRALSSSDLPVPAACHGPFKRPFSKGMAFTLNQMGALSISGIWEVIRIFAASGVVAKNFEPLLSFISDIQLKSTVIFFYGLEH